MDVADRLARLLGVADVSDRAGRVLGVVASITNPVDISDRAGRALGVVASITNAVDMADRAGRALGVVASITNPVDISDRTARLLGHVVGDGGIADTLIAGGTLNNGAANAVVASIAAPGAGVYEVLVNVVSIAGVATEAANLQLRHGVTVVGTLAQATPGPQIFSARRMTVAGGENIDVRLLAASTNFYHVTILATRLS